jgi:hypothetical protein
VRPGALFASGFVVAFATSPSYPSAMPMTLRRIAADQIFDDGRPIGRICRDPHAPSGSPWRWSLQAFDVMPTGVRLSDDRLGWAAPRWGLAEYRKQ